MKRVAQQPAPMVDTYASSSETEKQWSWQPQPDSRRQVVPEFMHEYTVEFRIHGHDLNVSAVTQELGLEPSLVRLAGERRDELTKWEEAMWSYDGFPGSRESKLWDSLEGGLSFVLEKLWPHRKTIDSYKDKYDVVLWCGHFQSSMDGGPTLSPGILKRLGDFEVELYLDNYLR